MHSIEELVGDRLLITSRRYWKYFEIDPTYSVLAKNQITEDIARVIVDTLSEEQLARARAHGVAGFGGGKVMDYAKCVYGESLAPSLLLIPGTITTDAHLTNSYAIRDFCNKKIRYRVIPYGYETKVDPELLSTIYKKEMGVSPTTWALSELFSHFTSSWEAVHVLKKPDLGDTLKVLAEEMRALPEKDGSKEWFIALSALFDFSLRIQDDFGVEYQEASEHYIAYYDEFVNGNSGPHGKLLANGIEFILTYQNNEYENLWHELKERYYLYSSPVKIDEIKMKKLLMENKFRKCLLEELL